MKSALLLFAALFAVSGFLAGGCATMKKILNDEPLKPAARSREVAAEEPAPEPRQTRPVVSRRTKARPPSLISSELSEDERSMAESITRENRLRRRDFNKSDKDDKAASDWVFGR